MSKKIMTEVNGESYETYKTYNITLYPQSFEKMIQAGNYDAINFNIKSINPDNMHGSSQEQESVEIMLVYRNKAEQPKKLVNEMWKKYYRPAIHEELLALGAQYPNLQEKFPITALGTIMQSFDYDGDKRFYCFTLLGFGGTSGGIRMFILEPAPDKYDKFYRFAFVSRKKQLN